jgi:phage FluMu gp28-like protein
MQINYDRPYLTTYQQNILDSNARYTITAASTKTGKTASHIIWLFEQALNLKINQSVWWVAPVYQQAEIAFRRMKAQVSDPNFFTSNESKLVLTTPIGSRIEFKSAEKPDNLYGDDVYAAVFDEASRAREDSWYALRSTLTATQGKCKLIGNVKGKKNWFYKLGEKAKAGEANMEYFKITAYDAVNEGILNHEEVEQAKKDLPDYIFKELYLAEPADDNSNPFGYENIEKCIIPTLSGTPVCYGIDLAKYTDWTVVIGLNEDGNVAHFDRFQMDWSQTLQKIKSTIGNTPAFIDSTGVGDPIVEQLQKEHPRIKGFKFTSQSKQQLIEGLVVAVQSQTIRFPNNVIADEMRNFEFEYTRTGVRYTAPQGLHDDCVMSLALAYDCKQHNKKGIFFYG